MNFLRLPPALRRAILHQPNSIAHPRRHLLTATSRHAQQQSSSSATALLSLSSSTLNSYTTSRPPQQHDLTTSSTFFTRHAPTLLYTSAHFRSFPPSPYPEVAFLGRSNVGKSSLLNALLGRPAQKPAHVSKHPGRTKTMNGFGIGATYDGESSSKKAERTEVDPRWKRFGRGGLVVVDMPGYGAASRAEWGEEIMKYLTKRQQLRRTYVLVDAEHGLKGSDIMVLTELRRQGVAHQVVLSKVDKLLRPRPGAPSPERVHRGLMAVQEMARKVRGTLNEAAGEAGGRNDEMGDILCCSAEKAIDDGISRHRRIGVDELRWSILTACGMDEGIVSKASRKEIESQAPASDRPEKSMAYEVFT